MTKIQELEKEIKDIEVAMVDDESKEMLAEPLAEARRQLKAEKERQAVSENKTEEKKSSKKKRVISKAKKETEEKKEKEQKEKARKEAAEKARKKAEEMATRKTIEKELKEAFEKEKKAVIDEMKGTFEKEKDSVKNKLKEAFEKEKKESVENAIKETSEKEKKALEKAVGETEKRISSGNKFLDQAVKNAVFTLNKKRYKLVEATNKNTGKKEMVHHTPEYRNSRIIKSRVEKIFDSSIHDISNSKEKKKKNAEIVKKAEQLKDLFTILLNEIDAIINSTDTNDIDNIINLIKGLVKESLKNDPKDKYKEVKYMQDLINKYNV